MESSPYLDPRFIVALVALAFTGFVALIGLIVWLVRLESKVNSNNEKRVRLELDFKESIKELDDELKLDRADMREWKKIFFAHATDTKIHHNEEMFKEFRSGIDRRFSGIETSLTDIGRKIDKIADAQ